MAAVRDETVARVPEDGDDLQAVELVGRRHVSQDVRIVWDRLERRHSHVRHALNVAVVMNRQDRARAALEPESIQQS